MISPAYESTEPIEPTTPDAAPTRFDGISLSIAPKNPRIKLETKLAQAKAAAQTEEREVARAADVVSVPAIQEDMVKSKQHYDGIKAKIEQVQQQIMGQQAPQYQKPQLGLSDIFAAGIASMIGGAPALNQSLEGMYGRGAENADRQYQMDAQNAQIQRQNALMQLEALGMDAQVAQRAYDTLQGRKWDIEDQSAKAAEAEKNRQVKLTLEQMKQEGKLDLKAVDFYKAVYGKLAPEKRSEAVAAALASLGKDAPPELLQAVNELNTKDELDRANKAFIEGPKTEGAQLDNEKKRIENEWLPKLLETKLYKSQKDAEFVATKIKYYPQYLQATMARVAIAQQLAANSIGNTEFDNRMDVWKTQGGARIKTYQQEIAGHVKRMAAIDKELGAVNKDTGVGLDPITSTAKTLEKQRIETRMRELQQKIEEELKTVPDVVPGADTPMPEGGAVDPSAMAPAANPLAGSIGGGAPRSRTRTRARTPQKKATPPKKSEAKSDGWTIKAKS